MFGKKDKKGFKKVFFSGVFLRFSNPRKKKHLNYYSTVANVNKFFIELNIIKI